MKASKERAPRQTIDSRGEFEGLGVGDEGK